VVADETDRHDKESSHALGWLMRNPIPDALVVVNLSGRGDKDVPQVAAHESR